jgi:polyvinyl alcohol dehydrogenase (cytochrome)
VWSAPAIDAARGLIYFGTGNDYTHPATPLSDAIVALEMKTGRIAWSRQVAGQDVFNAQCARGGDKDCGADLDFGAPILFVRAPGGREVLIAGQKSGVVWALDPADRGKVLWQTRIGVGGSAGGVQWGMASDGARVFAAVADAVRNAGDQGSPQIGNASFDPVKGGGLTALDVLTGAKVWFAPSTPCSPPREGCSPAQPGAVTVIPGAVISGSMDGHLRAFSTEDGHKLWDVDTQQRYTTVNGVEAQGGSLDGAGAVVVDGMLYINSGYPRIGGAPGNVLLAYGLDSSRP